MVKTLGLPGRARGEAGSRGGLVPQEVKQGFAFVGLCRPFPPKQFRRIVTQIT